MTQPARPTQPLADDPQLAALLRAETERRHGTLQLLAGESQASSAVRAVMAGDLADKYAEGHPGARFHGGCEIVDEIEELATARARDLFDAEYANVQPLSGSAAGQAVYAAFAQPGDPVLALRLMHGGHQTHGSRANFSGRWFSPVFYGVRPDDERIDYDQVRDLALVHRPRIIVAGSATYSRHIDFATLRAIADESDAVLWVDAAHLAGLVAGGVAPSPVPYADVVTVNTQKVFWGPRGGVLLARAEHAEAVAKAVYPFLQGGPSCHTIAAMAATFEQARGADYREYARRVVDNAAALSAALAERGLRTASGGTDTHLAVVDVSSRGHTGRSAATVLGQAGIVVDKAVLPFDPAPVALGSAIRVGTPVAAARGMRPEEMAAVAQWIDHVLSDESSAAAVRDEVSRRCGN